MLRLKKVAVTGGLSCGKTTVCRLLKEQGAYTLSADEIIHDLYSPETLLGKQIIALLGSEVLNHGVFDRKRIASKVFGNPSLLRQLEKLLHPEFQKVVEKHIDQITKKHQKYSLFVVEIPLLFESGLERFYDKTIAVIADEKIASERFIAKGGSLEDYRARSNHLMPMDQKAQRADFVLTNNGNKEDLKSAVSQIFNKLN